MVKKILKIIGIVLAVIVGLAAAFILFLTVTEFKPADVQDAEALTAEGGTSPSQGDTISILSWNIGYAGLGAGSDFFMDGGKGVAPADKDTVMKYLDGIRETVSDTGENKSDIHFFQETDSNSTRTCHIDERQALEGQNTDFALNYSCPFVPYPIPPIGTVNSGLLSVSAFPVGTSQRIALPDPFKWPVRIANLKRCLLADYIPIAGSDRYLVAVNLHLEAYDSGEGKAAQTAQLKEFMFPNMKKEIMS